MLFNQTDQTQSVAVALHRTVPGAQPGARTGDALVEACVALHLAAALGVPVSLEE